MWSRRWVLPGLGLLAAVTAVLFVLAPVDGETTTYHWSAGGAAQDTALPLFPYEPARMDVTFGCGSVTALGGNGLLLATTAEAETGGLRIEARGGKVTATLAGAPLAASQRCEWTVHSGPGGTSVTAGGTVLGRSAGKPVVNRLITDVRGATGLEATITPDTRYQSSPSVLKILLGVVSAASVVALLVVLRRRDSAGARRVRLLAERWWRPRGPDAAVAGTLGLWGLIGPSTVDDGYILTMLKAADDTGYVGNYFRWFNAPEAPFGWFYELYRPLAEVSAAAWWLRLPSLLLGVVAWLLIDRVLLRRFTTAPRPWVRWAAAAAFGVWYLPFDVGLRPEPWIVVGSLVVFALVERALVTGAMAPLAAGVLVAGATVAVTPTGIAAFMPFLAALVGIVRLVRREWLSSIAMLLGVGATALLFMTYDQSLGAILHATDVRTIIGPSYGFTDEIVRYESLFDPTDLEGALNRRLPVLLMLLSMLVLTLLSLVRRIPGLAAGPTRRLVTGSALYLVALAFTPTKWTHHFGALAGLGTLLIVLVVVTFARGALRAGWQRALVLALLTGVGTLSLLAPSRWWYLSNLGVTWADVPPVVPGTGVQVAEVVLVSGLLLAVAALFVSARKLAPSPVLVLAMVAVVLLEVGTVGLAVAQRWGTYTVGRANLASLAGGSCGVGDWLEVEPDLRKGILEPGSRHDPGAFTLGGGFPTAAAPPEPYGTPAAPVWGSDGRAGTLTSGWYPVPGRAGAPGAPPLAVPVAANGAVRATMELAGPDGTIRREPLALGPPGTWRDARVNAEDALRVRVVATDERAGAGWIAVGAPRLPEVVPLRQVVPLSEPVTLDWITPFYLPCREPASLAGGTTELVRHRFTSNLAKGPIGLMSDDPSAGGPFAPLVQLGTVKRIPVYLRGDMLREPLTLYRTSYPVRVRDVVNVPGG